MDAIYARQRHFYDFTRKYYLLGRDQLIDGLDLLHGGTVLEVGCGTGRNLIRAARAWPRARFFGIDISDEMLTTARANIARAGMADRITLARADATRFDARALFGVESFDRVVFSYTLSMIPDWRAALSAGAKVTGGRLECVDFGQQEELPRLFGRFLKRWLRRFDVEPRAELADALTETASRERMAMQMTPSYRGYAWAGRLQRA